MYDDILLKPEYRNVVFKFSSPAEEGGYRSLYSCRSKDAVMVSMDGQRVHVGLVMVID